ncbi:hypothetical protein FE257_011485 [Aspergillus nanangensis]|uniref:Zn(2)-C6 fungal-type domain-containing protein n=1 Tax=Aspergillus nanangensis TaxID=2582783 RepID=A0AAD4GSJ2_ASPNN|nr:hypothetical protein FE257_011485 [Aspergillus nanangensis]
MASESQLGSRKFRRTANACIACRQSKIKCSGTDPCANCQRRVMKCRFVNGGNRVMVNERYLLDLQQQARDRQRSPPKRSPDMAFGAGGVEADDDRVLDPMAISQVDLPAIPAIESSRSICTSPFTLPSRTIKNTRKDRRGWIWLAPTSVWSFTARLVVMMTERLNLDAPYDAANFLNRDVYPLRWRPAPPDDPPDISGLPSIDYALYLFNTVKFHLGSYRILDEESFLADLHDFYQGSAVEKANECRLWFVQFLLVLAFGHAFLLHSRNTLDPPGSKYFVRAMSLMPDYASLWRDSLLAIEVLALAGLFLYSIDHRESAHVHVNSFCNATLGLEQC